MIGVDTNILVHAHREDSQWHSAADRAVTSLAEGRRPWAIPWPCLHEFLAIATHPKIFDPPTPLHGALDQVQAWIESPTVVLLSEGSGSWEILQRTIMRGKVSGPMVHDARVAALCELHGVTVLWSADRDFGRFPDLTVENPLVSSVAP